MLILMTLYVPKMHAHFMFNIHINSFNSHNNTKVGTVITTRADEKSEVKKDEVVCPPLHRKIVAELRCESR